MTGVWRNRASDERDADSLVWVATGPSISTLHLTEMGRNQRCAVAVCHALTPLANDSRCPERSLSEARGTRLGRTGHIRTGNPGLSAFLPRCRGQVLIA
jgi:hypothetical protein